MSDRILVGDICADPELLVQRMNEYEAALPKMERREWILERPPFSGQLAAYIPPAMYQSQANSMFAS